jgi:c-di-GMP phosphodiesterase
MIHEDGSMPHTLRRPIQVAGDMRDVDESVKIIERDVGLSVKLLRYLNSAYLARRGTIRSIRQAVMMLGSHGVARWALLIALTTNPGTPRELSMIALTRARLYQSLSWEAGADPEQLFTIGLLSLADALLGAPLETVLDELPLTEEQRNALLHHTGVAGAILGAVLSHGRGEFDLPASEPRAQRCSIAVAMRCAGPTAR